MIHTVCEQQALAAASPSQALLTWQCTSYCLGFFARADRSSSVALISSGVASTSSKSLSLLLLLLLSLLAPELPALAGLSPSAISVSLHCHRSGHRSQLIMTVLGWVGKRDEHRKQPLSHQDMPGWGRSCWACCHTLGHSTHTSTAPFAQGACTMQRAWSDQHYSQHTRLSHS